MEIHLHTLAAMPDIPSCRTVLPWKHHRRISFGMHVDYDTLADLQVRLKIVRWLLDGRVKITKGKSGRRVRYGV